MRKSLISLISIIVTVNLSCPAYGQDIFKNNEITNEITYESTSDFLDLIPEWLDVNFREVIIKHDTTVIKYSNDNFVNIREYPDINSEIIGQLLYNANVEVIATYNDWACICMDSGLAFVSNQYLSENEMPKQEYSEEELYIIAHVLAGECQDCPDIEQLYVGSVVLNRKDHNQYPNTIEGVVFQKKQYECIRDGNYYREPTKRNWENARWLLEYGSILPREVVYQSRKKQGKGIYLQTKYHCYCY